MNIILTAIRIILLCASTYGYMRLISEKIAPELSIGFTFTGIGTVMFFAGLLNVLPETAVVLCAGGLICLGRAFIVKKQKLTLSLGGAFFLFMCALLLVRVYGCEFYHIDNFTHWGLTVRHMLAKNRFPNFTDSYIRFQSYPVSAGALIYYFCLISGIRAEWFQMLVHWACAAAMLSALFCLAKNTPAKVLCFIGAMLLLCVDNNFDQIMGDSTLGFVSLSAAAFCVHYGKDMRKKGLCLIPWLTYLISVKNSGALFVLYVLFLVFLWGGWKVGLAAAAAPLVTLLMWNRHVDYVFEGGMLSQHSMSLENFKRSLAAKRPGTVESIIDKMLHEVVSFANPYLAVLLLTIAAFVLVTVLLKKDRGVRMLLVYGLVCYVIYQVGMTAMYIFTMSEKEALRLASYPRYHGTILIFSAGAALMAVMLLSERVRALKNGNRWMTACCAVCLVAFAVSGMPRYSQYLRIGSEDYATWAGYRRTLENLSGEWGMEDESSYYMLISPEIKDVNILYNMVNCLTLADDVQLRTIGQIYSEDEINQCEYLVAFSDDQDILDYLYDHYGTRDRVIKLPGGEK